MGAILVGGTGKLCLSLLYVSKNDNLLEEKDLQLTLFLACINRTIKCSLHAQIALCGYFAIEILQTT